MNLPVEIPVIIGNLMVCPRVYAIPLVRRQPLIGAKVHEVPRFLRIVRTALMEALRQTPGATKLGNLKLPTSVLALVSCGIGLRSPNLDDHLLMLEKDRCQSFLRRRSALPPRSVYADIEASDRYFAGGNAMPPPQVTHVLTRLNISHTPVPFTPPLTEDQLLVQIVRGDLIGAALAKEAKASRDFWANHERVAGR